jgi:hypothetical protein
MRTIESMPDRLGGLRPPPLWLSALLIAASRGAYLYIVGVRMAPDSVNYAYWSARLVESGFDLPALLPQASVGFPAILYSLFVTLLALLRLAFGDGWAAATVALNLVASIALGLLIVRLTVRATGSAVAAWAALLLYLGCFDLLMWVPFVLSDSTFVLLAFGIFVLASARILGDSRGWAAVMAPAAAGIFYRPTGMVLIPDLAWALYLSRTGGRPISRWPTVAVLAALVAAGALVFAWVIQDPARWPLDSLSVAFRTVSAEYAAGQVVSGRPETYHMPPTGLTDILLLSADRFVHFFAPGAADYSAAHWIAQLAFFLPCYALACWLAVALWRGSTDFGPSERKVFLAAFGALFSYAVFHALVQVDFDWRYRTPILPHLILLAAGGFADLARRRAAR